jgi:hypothetical protein
MQCQYWKEGKGSCLKKAVPGSGLCSEHGGTQPPAERRLAPPRLDSGRKRPKTRR